MPRILGDTRPSLGGGRVTADIELGDLIVSLEDGLLGSIMSKDRGEFKFVPHVSLRPGQPYTPARGPSVACLVWRYLVPTLLSAA